LGELPELLAEILGLPGKRLQITLQLFHPGARFFLFPEIPRGLQKKPRRQ